MFQSKECSRFYLKDCQIELYKVYTLPNEESCYFHAILHSFNSSYRENSDEKHRTKLSRQFRNLLAEKLESSDECGTLIYDTLSEGTLRNFSASIPKFKCSNMVKILKKNKSVDNSYHELVCDYISRDIYLISEEEQDIYKFTNDKIYIKNRPSIVLLYSHGDPGHYSLLIEKRNGNYISTFDTNDPLIIHIKSRLLED